MTRLWPTPDSRRDGLATGEIGAKMEDGGRSSIIEDCCRPVCEPVSMVIVSVWVDASAVCRPLGVDWVGVSV